MITKYQETTDQRGKNKKSPWKWLQYIYLAIKMIKAFVEWLIDNAL